MGNQYFRTRFDERKAEELYKAGWTQVDIAHKLHVTPKLIYLRLKERGFICRNPHGKGKNNPNWRGSKAGYAAMHYRVQAVRGKAHYCRLCGSRSKKRKYEWHSRTLDYENIWDFIQVCCQCHREIEKKSLDK